jgi:hypothetical protein
MYRTFFLAAALAVLSADPTLAELQSVPSSPSFTGEELVIINRNASLLEMSKTNPWIVRRLLDALEKADTDSTDNKSPPPPSADGNSDNPDLGRIERASPEAVLDLFQLMKQAGEKKPIEPKQ